MQYVLVSYILSRLVFLVMSQSYENNSISGNIFLTISQAACLFPFPSGFCLQKYAVCVPHRSTIEVSVRLKSNICCYADIS